MPLYNEQTKQVKLEGTEKTWTRARIVTINNDLGRIPSISFLEDTVTLKVDGSELHRGGEALKENFSLAGTFPLLHPETGQLIGEGSHQQLQVLLYSMYISLVKKRDEAK